MGRELKRVPLDFKWPKGQVWKGYLNPYRSFECKSCDGSGLNPATQKISDEWYSFGKEKWVNVSANKRYNDLAHSNHITNVEVEALVKAGRLGDLMPERCQFDEETGKWMKWENGQKIETVKPVYPTAEAVNKWNRHGMGHDAINKWICVEARAKHLGVYGHCEYCNGEGVIWQSEAVKKLHEDWQSFEPPTGEGFQLWETTSEGSPYSPVFDTLEKLCEWCEENASTFARFKASKEEWFRMLSNDFVSHQEGNAVFL